MLALCPQPAMRLAHTGDLGVRESAVILRIGIPWVYLTNTVGGFSAWTLQDYSYDI